jgi:ubiquinone/menaquinone biosynthesis C-methylase UbiE
VAEYSLNLGSRMRSFSLARIWTPKTYDWISRYYDRLGWLFSPSALDVHSRLLEGIGPGSILDVGCGTGTLLDRAREMGLACYGVDTSSGMLTQTRIKVGDAELVRASFYHIPYADEQFDYVVETNAVSGVHIDPRRVLAEMLRVCKEGGEVRLADYCVPARENWRHRILRAIGILIGDYPYNYPSLIRELGYEPVSKVLGGAGMYQLLVVQK